MAENKVITFSKDEINNLEEAIKYYRAREGSFSSQDKLIPLFGKIKHSNLNSATFNEEEINLLIKVLDENLHFMQNYDGYNFLPEASAITRKQTIIEPLYKLRNRFKEL